VVLGILIIFVCVGFGGNRIWMAHHAPKHVFGFFRGDGILRLGSERIVVKLYWADRGLYFVLVSKVSAVRYPERFWAIIDETYLFIVMVRGLLRLMVS
jgi:hypothetical protein